MVHLTDRFTCSMQSGAVSQSQALVELRNVTYCYTGSISAKAGKRLAAVRNLSFEVYQGEVLALLGPSGCGKSTTLRLIAGLEQPEQGEIWLNGVCVSAPGREVPPENRHLGMVFQDYALFPHLNALENVVFGLHQLPKKERCQRAEESLNLVGLRDQADRYPHQLSGGQQQRVALARALAPNPPVVLLDEPFSNLDAALRGELRAEMREILARAGATSVFVTHDQAEALALGDRIAVLHDGRMEQIGTPDEIFQHPNTRFVADFMGQADFLPACVTREGLQTEIGCVPQDITAAQGTYVDVLVRYDDLNLCSDPHGTARIIGRIYEGPSYTYIVGLPSGQRVRCKTSHVQSYPIGTPVRVELMNDHPLACFADGLTLK